MSRFASSFPGLFRSLLLAVVVFVSLGSVPLRSQENTTLSDDTSAALQKLQPLIAARDWDASLALIEPLLAKAGPNSYDRALLLQIKAQVLFFQNKNPASAIEPMETALALSDAHKYFDAKTAQGLRYFLANLYYQRAFDLKNDPAAESQAYAKARDYIERWLRIATAKNSEAKPSAPDLANSELFYASVLFGMSQKNPKHPDESLTKKTLVEAEKGMRASLVPNSNLYVIELAAYQQLNDYAHAAEVLEHLVKTKPDNKSYWQTLTAFYLNLASRATETKDEEKARQYNIRAIITMERAQQHGAMHTPADNFNLVATYFNAGQYEQAAELLRNGLHNKTIESTLQHWKFLAQIYQLTHKNLDAVEVLTEASEYFPESGQLDYMAAQILYSLDKTAEALKAIQRCVSKDGGDQPSRSWIFMVYLAFELQKFDLASQAIESAAKYPDAKPAEINQLRTAVKAAIQERDAAIAKSSKQNL